MSKKIPAYCLHKASGQAYVKLGEKRHYLGKHGSPESHRKYADTISGWQEEQTSVPKDLKVRQLTAFYWKHAQVTCFGFFGQGDSLILDIQSGENRCPKEVL